MSDPKPDHPQNKPPRANRRGLHVPEIGDSQMRPLQGHEPVSEPDLRMIPAIRIGTAGWSIPKAVAGSFEGDGRHLSRYSQELGCVEINSSFQRIHSRSVYERWARQSADGFRYSVKLPKAISHDARLRNVDQPLAEFMGQVDGLGSKLAVLLVQLPPSFEYDERVVGSFFRKLRRRFGGAMVCEPRHASWFTGEADKRLALLEVARAAADPARHAGAEQPGGFATSIDGASRGVRYFRWHGSPRMYWSSYPDDWLTERAREIVGDASADAWCIFDNTAAGAAAQNALRFRAVVGVARASQPRFEPPT